MGHSFRLFIVTVILVLISAFLLFKGIEEEFQKRQVFESTVPVTEVVELQEDQILGEEIREESTSAAFTDEDLVLVTKVVDGDTIEVSIDNVLQRVRLIGVDTPETVHPTQPKGCFGSEASNETKRLLSGKRVILEKDVSETDAYKRLLRYVYLPLEDGRRLFVNDYLVREGYGQVLTYPPDVKFNEQFLEAQRQAKERDKGLWGRCF